MNENTYVFDIESAVELSRLIQLSRVMISALGSSREGLKPLAKDAKILDVACGPGSWVLDIAFELPDAEVAGIDISEHVIRYAKARAITQQRYNARFEVMNILQPFDFSSQTVDLVNCQLLTGVVKHAKWIHVLTECARILRPGGQIRLIEPREIAGKTTSPAYERISQLLQMALQDAGYVLDLSTMFPYLLRNTGYTHIHQTARVLDFSYPTPTWYDMRDQLRAGAELTRPFLTSSGHITQHELQQLYATAELEWYQEHFSGTYVFLITTALRASGTQS